MRFDRNRFFTLEELDAGGTSTPPVVPPAVASATADVASATQEVATAIGQTSNEAMETLLTSVKDVLGGVTAELKRANDLAERGASAAAPATPAAAPEPEVDIPVPVPPERKIRRNGRKVTRRG